MRESRGSAAGLLHIVSIHFVGWYNNKGLKISMWTYHILSEPRFICVSLVMCFNIFILLIAYCLLLLLCDHVFPIECSGDNWHLNHIYPKVSPNGLRFFSCPCVDLLVLFPGKKYFYHLV